MNKFFPLLALAFGLQIQATQSVAATIDFESLYHDDADVADVGYRIEEDGYRLENSGAYPFGTYGARDPEFTGSTALFNDNDGGITTLTRIDGLPFNLISIDLAELILGGRVYSVVFNGITVGLASVTQTFLLDGQAGAQTFAFDPSFSKLVSVSWANTADYHQFDNIAVNVPEPETLSVMLCGLGIIGTLVRRRRRSA